MQLHPDLVTLYVTSSGAVRQESARRNYLNEARRVQASHPDRKIEDWSTDELVAYILSGDPSPATIRWRKSIVMTLFGWAFLRGLIQVNPAAKLKELVKAPKVRVRPGNWLSGEEVKKLWNSFDIEDEMEHRDRVVLALGLFTGLRLSELASLTWDKFDGDMTMMRVKGKGGVIADLPVAGQLRTELLAWRDRALGPAVVPSFRSVWGAGERYRTIDWDVPLGSSGIYDVVSSWSSRVGKRIAPHDLRRSFCGWLRECGLDPKTMQDMMRHKNIQTTFDVYLDRDPGRLSAAMIGLERAL